MGAGDLTGKISLDPTQATGAIDHVKAKATGLDKALAGIGSRFGKQLLGLAGLATVMRGVREFKEFVETTGELSEKLKITNEEAQKLMFAAAGSGKTVEEYLSSAAEKAGDFEAVLKNLPEIKLISDEQMKRYQEIMEGFRKFKVEATIFAGNHGLSIVSPLLDNEHAGSRGVAKTKESIFNFWRRRRNPTAEEKAFAESLRLTPKQESEEERSRIMAEKRARDARFKSAQEREQTLMPQLEQEDAARRAFQELGLSDKLKRDRLEKSMREMAGLFTEHAGDPQKISELNTLLFGRGKELFDLESGLNKRDKRSSDSLVAVGNFLGRDPYGGMDPTRQATSEIKSKIDELIRVVKQGNRNGVNFP